MRHRWSSMSLRKLRTGRVARVAQVSSLPLSLIAVALSCLALARGPSTESPASVDIQSDKGIVSYPTSVFGRSWLGLSDALLPGQYTATPPAALVGDQAVLAPAIKLNYSRLGACPIIGVTGVEPRTDNRLGVAVDIDGGVVAIGAPLGKEGGTAYIVSHRDGTWIAHTLRSPSGSGHTGSALGYGSTVAVDRNTVAIAQPYSTDSADQAGAVFVYVTEGRGWRLQAEIQLSGGANGRGLGWDLDLEGDTLVAVARDIGASPTQGNAVYVFERESDIWAPPHRLAPKSGEMGHDFGFDVDLDGDTIAVGSFGGVHLFSRIKGGWHETTILTKTNEMGPMQFGAAVDLEDGRLLIGAPTNSPGSWVDNPGRVYEFELSGTEWVETTVLKNPHDGSSNFGGRIAAVGDTALLVALDDVYLWRRRLNTWRAIGQVGFERKLRNSGCLGYNLAMSETYAVIGSPCENVDGGMTGSAYIVERNCIPHEPYPQPPLFLPILCQSQTLESGSALPTIFKSRSSHWRRLFNDSSTVAGVILRISIASRQGTRPGIHSARSSVHGIRWT